MPYAVIAHYRCDPTDADLVRAALMEMREHTLREPGNLLYIVHKDADEEAAFTLYEQYTDRGAFHAHTQSEHFAKLIIATVRPRLADRTVWSGDVL